MSRFSVRRTRLDNGITVLHERQPSLPIVAVAVYVRCGSGEETPETSGITNLMQTMLMKGAGGRDAGDLATLLEGMGAHVSPFGGRDESGLSLSVLKDKLPEAMPVFRDIVFRPDFPGEPLEREKTKLLGDIAALADQSLQFTMLKFTECLFEGHAYGMPMIGSPASVPTLGAADLSAWHAGHYRPERMVVSVVGDIEEAEALDMVRAHFGFAEPGAPLPEVPPFSRPPESRRVNLAKDVSEAVLIMGWPGAARGSEDRYAVDVLMSVLSGMGNRLFTELRDRLHLCYSTGMFSRSMRAGGMVAAYIGTDPASLDQAHEGMRRELLRARETEPTPEEMERARNTIAGGYVIDLQRRGARASLFAQEEASGLGFEEALVYLDHVRAVTPRQVRDAAARYFDLDRYILAELKPDPA